MPQRIAKSATHRCVCSSRPNSTRDNALVSAVVSRSYSLLIFRCLCQVMHKGLPHGCPKGTSLEFGTGGGKLSLTVDDKAIGSVASKPLAKAFADIYCDKNAVCKMQKIPFATGAFVGAPGGVVRKRGRHARNCLQKRAPPRGFVVTPVSGVIRSSARCVRVLPSTVHARWGGCLCSVARP